MLGEPPCAPRSHRNRTEGVELNPAAHPVRPWERFGVDGLAVDVDGVLQVVAAGEVPGVANQGDD